MPRNRGPWHIDICYYCKKLGHWKKKCPVRKQRLLDDLSIASFSCGPIAQAHVRWYWVPTNSSNTWALYGCPCTPSYYCYHNYPMSTINYTL